MCSGIEAATVAWHPLGWSPVAFSDIDPFCQALLRHHYPEVPVFGDFTHLRDEPWIVMADLLIAGTPCQSFSPAGLRQSMSDDRGVLALEYLRLANAIDDLRRLAGLPPAWILWENVPGVLDTRDNAFGAFLGGLCGCDAAIDEPRSGRWPNAGVVAGPQRGAAWRVLDAQYYGLAQRRERVFVVARAHPRAWDGADALLPIAESVRWHPAPRRSAPKDLAPTLEASAGRSGYGNQHVSGALAIDTERGTITPRGASAEAEAPQIFGGIEGQEELAAALKTQSRAPDYKGHALIVNPAQQAFGGLSETPEVAPTLTAQDNRTARNAKPLVVASLPAPVAFGAALENYEVAPAMMRQNRHNPEEATFVVEPPPDPADEPVMAIQDSTCDSMGQGGVGLSSEGVAYSLLTRGRQGVITRSNVRRLTPRECERLMGFPDDYTEIPYRGKPASQCPDSPRFVALGNSMAVPLLRWVGQQIQRQNERTPR